MFEGTYSSCRFNEEIWLRPDNERASFVGCRLKNADLTFSAMEWADFSKADLEGAVFDEGLGITTGWMRGREGRLCFARSEERRMEYFC